MNRRLFFASIAATGSMTAAPSARPTLAFRPLPTDEEGRAKGDGKGKSKRKHRKGRTHGK